MRDYFPKGTTDETLVNFMENNARYFKDTYIGTANEILEDMVANSLRVAF